jgi:hypothetical protein
MFQAMLGDGAAFGEGSRAAPLALVAHQPPNRRRAPDGPKLDHLVGALVHFQGVGKVAPNPNQLFNGRLTPDRSKRYGGATLRRVISL